MTEETKRSERTLVSEALDELCQTLQPYVDDAMSAAFGPEWPDRVADDNARRNRGKRHPVSRNDLQVLLRQIQFQRISPWDGRGDSPKIRAYASELITVRNNFAHNSDELHGEYPRLCDTINRLLNKLNLPVPEVVQVQVSDLERTVAPSVPLPVPSIEIRDVEKGPNLIDEAVSRFGEDVRRPAELFLNRSSQSIRRGIAAPHGEVLLLGDAPWLPFREFIELVETLLPVVHGWATELDELDGILSEGKHDGKSLPAALAAMTKWGLLGANVQPARDINKTILVCFAQFELYRKMILKGADLRREGDKRGLHEVFPSEISASFNGDEELYITRELNETGNEIFRAYDQIVPNIEAWKDALTEFQKDPNQLLLRAYQSVAKLPEGSHLVHQLLFEITFSLSQNIDVTNTSERLTSELKYLAESTSHLRMIIASLGTPDIKKESHLASMLRREGQIYNDLELPIKAIQAFARADEILDRFPLADPGFREF